MTDTHGRESLVLSVPSISCEGCAGAIQRILGALPGVYAPEVDVSAKEVRLAFDPAVTGSASIRARLEAAGYPPA